MKSTANDYTKTEKPRWTSPSKSFLTSSYSERVDSKDLEFVISYLKCELFGQLIDWLNHDMSYDIVEHSRILCRMFAGSMRMVCQKYKIL